MRNCPRKESKVSCADETAAPRKVFRPRSVAVRTVPRREHRPLAAAGHQKFV
jgi:hypothetical protein